MTELDAIVKLIVENGLSVICVGYLIYFQHNTMTKMTEVLNQISTRLAVIEHQLKDNNGKN